MLSKKSVTVSIRKFRIIVLVWNRIEYWSNFSIQFEISNIRTALDCIWPYVYVCFSCCDYVTQWHLWILTFVRALFHLLNTSWSGQILTVCLITCTAFSTKVHVLLHCLHEQKCFTVPEVAADWHELLLLPWIMLPFIVHANERLDPQCSAQTCHQPTRPSPKSP